MSRLPRHFWLSPALAVLAAVVFILLVRPKSPDLPPGVHQNWAFEEEKEEKENGLSGAREALDLWAAQRAYPYSIIPDIGHALGYDLRKMLRTSGTAAANPFEDMVEPWVSIGPNNIGGRTLALALRPDDPNILFAGSASGGLWKSTTGGVGADAWDYVETGFPALAISAIAIDPRDPDVMYVGTGEVYRYQNAIGGDVYRTTRGSYGMGILKSTDGGATWSKSLDWSLAQSRGIWSVRIHPANSSIVYAATTEGVYKSLDAGASWAKALDVVMAMDLQIHPTMPETVFAACGDFGSGGTGLYRSLNGGASWTRLTTGLPPTWTGKALIAIAPSGPHIVYASIADAGFGIGLYRSSNYGTSWSLVNATDYAQYQGWYSHYVLVSPSTVNNLFVGGIDIWRSTNSGTSLSQVSDWTQLYLGTPEPGEAGGGPLYAHADHHCAVWHPTQANTVYFGSDGGVFKSVDGGNTFIGLNGGYVTTQFYQGFSNSARTANLAIGGMQDNLTAIYEGTTAWRRVIGGDGCWAAVSPASDGTLYGSAQFLTLFRSYDGGANWTDIIPPEHATDITGFVAPFVLAPSQPTRIYAGRSRVYRSDNEGTSWTVTNGGVPIDGDNPVFALAVSATDPDLVFATTAPNGSRPKVLRTLNGGATWTDVTGSLPDRYLSDVAIDPANPRNVYVSVMGFGTAHVYRSIDQGASWIDFGQGLPDVPASALEIDPERPFVVYVGTDLGVYVTPFYLMGWFPFTAGMPAASVNDLEVSAPAGTIRAATHGNGVYERDILPVSITGSEGQPVAAPALALRVAPNPLRAESRVTFTLPEPGTVHLALYDVNGREVTVLADGPRGAGEQSVPLAPAGLARGVYFLKLKSQAGTTVSRVVFLK